MFNRNDKTISAFECAVSLAHSLRDIMPVGDRTRRASTL